MDKLTKEMCNLDISRKRKREETIDDIYEEDILTDYESDEEVEKMMDYYKSILIDEANDYETNTPLERQNAITTLSVYTEIVFFRLPVQSKRRKLNDD